MLTLVRAYFFRVALNSRVIASIDPSTTAVDCVPTNSSPYEGGKSRWEAAKITGAVAQFMPVRGATNSFQFNKMSKNRWTATIIPANGKRVVYEMRAK